MRARRILLAAVAVGALSVSGMAMAAGDDGAAMGQGQAGIPLSGSSPETALSEVQVRDLQNALNNAGHEVTVDGEWGEETEAALSDYQRERGLAVTGLPDQETMAAMEADDNSAFSSDAYGTGGTAGPAVGTGASGLTGMTGKSEAPAISGRERDAIVPGNTQPVIPSTPDGGN